MVAFDSIKYVDIDILDILDILVERSTIYQAVIHSTLVQIYNILYKFRDEKNM